MKQFDIKLKERYFRAESITGNEQYIFYKTKRYNCVIQVERSSGAANLIRLPEEYDQVIGAYRVLEYYEGFLYVFPFGAKDILKINIEDKTMERIPLPKEYLESEAGNYVIQSYLWGETFVLYGYGPEILLFHTKSNSFEHITGIKDLFPLEFSPNVWFGDSALKESILYTYLATTKSFLITDLDKKQIKKCDVPIEGNSTFFDGICIQEDSIWFIPREEDKPLHLCKWDVSQNAVCEYECSTVWNRGVFPYGWCCYYNDRIWSLPVRAEEGLCYSVKNQVAEILQDIPRWTFSEMESQKGAGILNYSSVYFTPDHKMISVHIGTGAIVEVDLSTRRSKTYEIQFSREHKNIFSGYEWKYIGKKQLYYESKQFGLEDYLGLLLV